MPLLVLTADRPPELRDVGAGQTIDQVKLYGTRREVVRRRSTTSRPRRSACAGCASSPAARSGPRSRAAPGPVHLNFALREPLVLDGAAARRRAGRRRPRRRAAVGDAVPGTPREPPRDRSRASPRSWTRARARVLVAGRAERDPRLGAALAAFAERAGDPAAGRAAVRRAPRRGGRRPLRRAAARRRRGPRAHAPELVLRVGDLPTSKPLRQWLHGLDGALQVAFDPDGAWQDPAGAVATDPRRRPAALPSSAVGAALERRRDARLAGAAGATPTAPRRAAIAATLGPAGPQRAARRRRARVSGCRPAATLLVASSMPVRDVETFFPVRDDPPRVLSNRGANGIDGTVSTAFGVAAAADGPVVLLIGDVALAHDVGGLLAARRLGLALTIVLLDNDGGGIFDFLPVSARGRRLRGSTSPPRTGSTSPTPPRSTACGYERAQDPERLPRGARPLAGRRRARRSWPCAPIARPTSRCTARCGRRWRPLQPADDPSGSRTSVRLHARKPAHADRDGPRRAASRPSARPAARPPRASAPATSCWWTRRGAASTRW